MKKFILLLTMVLFSQLFINANAKEPDKTINLHTDGAYILLLNTRPIEMTISNPQIINAEVTTEIYSQDSQIVIKTLTEGIAYINYKLKNAPQTIKVLVDNNAPVDKDVIEIDKVKG